MLMAAVLQEACRIDPTFLRDYGNWVGLSYRQLSINHLYQISTVHSLAAASSSQPLLELPTSVGIQVIAPPRIEVNGLPSQETNPKVKRNPSSSSRTLLPWEASPRGVSNSCLNVSYSFFIKRIPEEIIKLPITQLTRYS
ncbi:unnamed protein product [Nezara viridula]|uniref:Uncharacterized protein n=1 Tax=Nezara viridula TaxID=85310 RepID=A0A9P0HHC8_NEZVI|nr:unnamed protein product [Nezara viridula]